MYWLWFGCGGEGVENGVMMIWDIGRVKTTNGPRGNKFHEVGGDFLPIYIHPNSHARGKTLMSFQHGAETARVAALMYVRMSAALCMPVPMRSTRSSRRALEGPNVRPHSL